MASQAQLYLSRGCPFDCAFCMERAKREVSWRAFSVERAIAEARRLDDWLDLSSWTLYVADALFGMRGGWRKAVLDRLAARPLRARKLWLLIRVDMVDEEDLRLFGAANCGLGFGLESGDPAMLAIARKAGRLDSYLDRMRDVAARARELDVPWGANVICGHPGETEASMRASAAYLRALFLDPRGTTGFLSVDPFRLYPGSPIDAERGAYEARFGAVFHRPEWWNDGDQELLSEWIDPSRELTYRRRAALQAELLGPIVRAIPAHFRYAGRAGDDFRRAIDDQIDQLAPGPRLHLADRHYAWNRYLGRRAAAEVELAGDDEVAELARAHRREAMPAVLAAAGIGPMDARATPIAAALTDVPRERFVPLDAVAASVRDEPIALVPSAVATSSAMHAYAAAYAAARVAPGDRVLDLGAGTGYGAALLARLVGATGSVRAVEIDPALAAHARAVVPRVRGAGDAAVEVVTGDALDPEAWGDGRFDRVVIAFALPALPPGLAAFVAEGGVVVAPIGPAAGPQELTRFSRRGDVWSRHPLGQVLYVPARPSAGVISRPRRPFA
jgi:protein-L-isoaspartate(D-aspartate) O-methyltransferase